jgi:hypothetical protein
MVARHNATRSMSTKRHQLAWRAAVKAGRNSWHPFSNGVEVLGDSCAGMATQRAPLERVKDYLSLLYTCRPRRSRPGPALLQHKGCEVATPEYARFWKWVRTMQKMGQLTVIHNGRNALDSALSTMKHAAMGTTKTAAADTESVAGTMCYNASYNLLFTRPLSAAEKDRCSVSAHWTLQLSSTPLTRKTDRGTTSGCMRSAAVLNDTAALAVAANHSGESYRAHSSAKDFFQKLAKDVLVTARAPMRNLVLQLLYRETRRSQIQSTLKREGIKALRINYEDMFGRLGQRQKTMCRLEKLLHGFRKWRPRSPFSKDECYARVNATYMSTYMSTSTAPHQRQFDTLAQGRDADDVIVPFLRGCWEDALRTVIKPMVYDSPWDRLYRT